MTNSKHEQLDNTAVWDASDHQYAPNYHYLQYGMHSHTVLLDWPLTLVSHQWRSVAVLDHRYTMYPRGSMYRRIERKRNQLSYSVAHDWQRRDTSRKGLL